MKRPKPKAFGINRLALPDSILIPSRKTGETMKKSAVQKYLAAIGRKGGLAKGPSKARDPELASKAGKASAAARKIKREAK